MRSPFLMSAVQLSSIKCDSPQNRVARNKVDWNRPDLSTPKRQPQNSQIKSPESSENETDQRLKLFQMKNDLQMLMQMAGQAGAMAMEIEDTTNQLKDATDCLDDEIHANNQKIKKMMSHGMSLCN